MKFSIPASSTASSNYGRGDLALTLLGTMPRSSQEHIVALLLFLKHAEGGKRLVVQKDVPAFAGLNCPRP